jgi:hypothetical protein
MRPVSNFHQTHGYQRLAHCTSAACPDYPIRSSPINHSSIDDIKPHLSQLSPAPRSPRSQVSAWTFALGLPSHAALGSTLTCHSPSVVCNALMYTNLFGCFGLGKRMSWSVRGRAKSFQLGPRSSKPCPGATRRPICGPHLRPNNQSRASRGAVEHHQSRASGQLDQGPQNGSFQKSGWADAWRRSPGRLFPGPQSTSRCDSVAPDALWRVAIRHRNASRCVGL